MSSVQCEGTTKSGIRCRKTTKDTSKRCHNHRIETPASRPVLTQPVTVVIDLSASERVSSSTVYTYTIQTRSRKRTAMIAPAPAPAPPAPAPAPAPVDRVKPRPTHTPRPTRPKRPNHSEEHSHSDKNEDCCICYEQMSASDALDCSHMVCNSCTKKLRDDRCPMCRAEIKSKYISSRDKARMNQRKKQDAIDRANEAFRSYLASQNQATIYIPSSASSRTPIILGGGIHIFNN